MRFKNKVAIITGGGSGIGQAVAIGIIKEGGKVIINDKNVKLLFDTAEKIKSLNGDATTIEGDITNEKTMKDLVITAFEKYKKIDILFNHVGGEVPGTKPLLGFMEISDDYFDKMLEFNLKTTVKMCKLTLEKMIKRKYGKIINTGAIAGRGPGIPGMVTYSTVKGGIIAFTKALASEMAQYNINVNCVSPGPTETLGYRKVLKDIDEKKALEIVPLKRMGIPEEIASAVLYLASDEASFITGQTIAVDGGATMI